MTLRPKEPVPPAPPRMSEAQFMRQVCDLARRYGWHRQFHVHDSRRSNPGWPDCVFVRPPEILFIELKGEKTRIRPEQGEWLTALLDCGLEAMLIRPVDFDRLHARLARRAQPLVEAA